MGAAAGKRTSPVYDDQLSFRCPGHFATIGEMQSAGTLAVKLNSAPVRMPGGDLQGTKVPFSSARGPTARRAQVNRAMMPDGRRRAIDKRSVENNVCYNYFTTSGPELRIDGKIVGLKCSAGLAESSARRKVQR